jgi:predicted nuclease of predicted toxin-antitoxin system
VKLLLDENLSRRLVNDLQKVFPDSTQVALAGLEQATDTAIWEFCRQHDYVLLTKDEDFLDLQSVWGFPPKIIWLRVGNISNASLKNSLISAADEIEAMLLNPDIGYIEFY